MTRKRMFVEPKAVFGFALLAVFTALGCSKADTSASTPADSTAATAAPASTSSSAQSGRPRIRGTVAGITDTSLTLTSDSGEIKISVVGPLKVFASGPAKLDQVTANSFVGVTSVAQPDGTERATEIHIFPEEMRGTGEGSRPMGRRGGGNGQPNTMTNGTVAGADANGGGKASTMTNGTISANSAGTLTVQYAGGTKTITVPPDVTVTAIAPRQTKLVPGTSVTVIADRNPDGTLKASAVIIGGGRGGRGRRGP
jgi:hypothetical protein